MGAKSPGALRQYSKEVEGAGAAAIRDAEVGGILESSFTMDADLGGLRRRYWLSWVWKAPLGLGLLGGALVIYANLAAERAGEGRLYDEVEDVPEKPVGVVFGTSPWIGSRDNLYFVNRIDAAVELWESGKVECLLVSGDNRERYYNEPEEMRAALMARGVPKEKIVRDFAGRSTFDTVVRAKEIFLAPGVIFVSQRFQNERACYIARAKGLECAGFNAEDVGRAAGIKTRIREVGARVKMWLDVRVLGTRPELLGKEEYLPIEGHPLTPLPESPRSAE